MFWAYFSGYETRSRPCDVGRKPRHQANFKTNFKLYLTKLSCQQPISAVDRLIRAVNSQFQLLTDWSDMSTAKSSCQQVEFRRVFLTVEVIQAINRGHPIRVCVGINFLVWVEFWFVLFFHLIKLPSWINILFYLPI